MDKLEGKWLIAASGGPDSMALLDMCHACGMEIGIAHVDYHHRPEAPYENEYLEECANNYHYPFYLKTAPTIDEGNFEAIAREYRYTYFKELIEEYEYKGVLLGHHEDDLLETYFMQEKKNITPAYYGLKEESIYKGILLKRPLLNYTKQDLLDYCEKNHVKFFVDHTNDEDIHERNRVRHEIVDQLTPSERKIVRKEIDQKNAILQERRCRVKTYIQEDKISLEKYRSLDEEDRVTVLRMLVEPMPKKNHFSLAYIKELDQILLEKDDFCLEVGETNLVQEDGFFFLHDGYETYSYTIHSKEEIFELENPCFKVVEGKEGVNAVTVKEEDFPLTLRTYQEGDYIQLSFGKKKVSRFFIDRHIPLYKRKTWPILENSQKQVILLPGLGCNMSHFSIEPDFNVIQYPS